MAKKSSPTLDQNPSPLADPFDSPNPPEEPLQPPPPLKTGPSCGQMVGGCIEIVLIALIVVILCGLITGGAVYLGQQQGVLAAEPPGALPTAVPGSLDAVPTVAPLNVPTLPAASPERTLPPAAETVSGTAEPTVAACADGAAWWFSQQAAFDALTRALPDVAFGGGNADAARIRLTAQRDALQAAGAPLCLEAAYAALLTAYDESLAGLDALADPNGLLARVGAVTDSLANTLVALWDRGVFTAVDAPTTRQVARGSGSDCAEDWRVAFTEVWSQFVPQAAGARNATGLTLNLAIGQLTALRDRAEAFAAPDCVRDVRQLALLWMASELDKLRAQAAGDAEAERAALRQSAQTAVQLRAWQTWLELPSFG